MARNIIKETSSSTTIKNLEKIGDSGVAKILSHSGCFGKILIIP